MTLYLINPSTVSGKMALEYPNVLLYVQYLLRMYNSAMPYIEALVSIYHVENRFIRISNISAIATLAQLIFLKSYEHLHFSDPVVEISDHHVENVISLGNTIMAIHGRH